MGMTSTGFYVREADRDRVAQPQTDPVIGKRPSYVRRHPEAEVVLRRWWPRVYRLRLSAICEMLLHVVNSAMRACFRSQPSTS